MSKAVLDILNGTDHSSKNGQVESLYKPENVLSISNSISTNNSSKSLETINVADAMYSPLISYKTKKEIISDKSSWDYIYRSFIAGGLAGCAAKTCVAPLDRVKILFQTNNPHYSKYSGSVKGIYKTMNSIYAEYGLVGLYQGHSVTLMRIFPYAAVKFMAYEQIKNFKFPFISSKDSNIKHFVAGSIAGSFSVFVSYPLDLLRVRLAFEVRNPINVVNPHTNVKSGFISSIESYFSNRSPMFRTVVNIYKEPNPLFMRLPYYSQYTPPEGSTVLPKNNRIIVRSTNFIAGIMNFYQGFAPTIYGIIPYGGVSFLVYENLKKFFKSKSMAPFTTITPDYMVFSDAIDTPILNDTDFNSKREKNNTNSNQSNISAKYGPQLKWWSYLLCGSIAGVISQTTSYPLEVIRRNMQVEGARRLRAVSDGEKEVGQPSKKGTWQTAKYIYSIKGWRGFFVGLSIGYIKVIPMSATSFFVYEFLKTQLNII